MAMSSEIKFLESTGSMDDMESGSDKKSGERAEWGGKIEFILTCIGYAIGLGTVWRFPYLCYKNGGGAFLIPYIIMMSLVGLPLFYMELAMGQFASLGPLAIWKFCPIFKGLGFGAVLIALMVAIYYNVIIAICFYFLFKSMAAEVPWAHCNNPWNTAACQTLEDLMSNKMIHAVNVTALNATVDGHNASQSVLYNVTEVVTKTPSEEFFYNHVLQITDGMEHMGHMRWELAGCLLLSWIVVTGVLIKGISSLGKVVYFTALFPYVLLTVLLIRGCLLEGSGSGILYYLTPQWERLKQAEVWSDAAVQVFYALSVATGGLIAMSSYNKFNNNILRDSLIVSGATLGTSIWAGLVIFSVLGYMATIKNTSVEKVAAQGPGLTFVVYPEALSTMPLPPLWSILFFFMMIILGFSSEFSLMECFLTAMLDEYPQWLKTDRKREIIFRVGACAISFLVGLPMCMEGGFYLLTLVDVFAGGFPLIVVGITELLAVNWVYGFKRFHADIEIMTGRKSPMFFKIALAFVAPVMMLAVFGFTIYQHKPLEFRHYVYPPKFTAIGWLIVTASVGFIPLGAIVVLWRAGGYELVKKVSKPLPSWGPANECDRVGTIYERKGACNTEPSNSATSSATSEEDGRLLDEYEETEKL